MAVTIASWARARLRPGVDLAGHEVAPDGVERRGPAVDPDPVAGPQASRASRRRRPGVDRARPGGGRGRRAAPGDRGSAGARHRPPSGSRWGRTAARRCGSAAGRRAGRSGGRTSRAPGPTASRTGGRRSRSCAEPPGPAGVADRDARRVLGAIEVDLPRFGRRDAGRPAQDAGVPGRTGAGPGRARGHARSGRACSVARPRHRAPVGGRAAAGRPRPGRRR